MLARLHHYEELSEHVAFFKVWFGRHWERCVMGRAGTYLDEISGVMNRRRSFNRTLLPRLRKLRLHLEAQCPCYNLANSPRDPGH